MTALLDRAAPVVVGRGEAALRLARRATGRPGVLVCRSGHAPVTDGVIATPFPAAHRHGCDETATRFALRELDHVLRTISAPADTAAIVMEPVLYEDCVPATTAFVEGLRERADRHGFLLIVDEVRTGFGRTGRFWAHEHFGVTPDVLIAGEFDVIEDERLVRNAKTMGARLRAGLQAVGATIPTIRDVRGLGLLLATEFVADGGTAARVQRAALERGLIVELCGRENNIVRMTPPLDIDEAGVDETLRVWAAAVATGVWAR